MALMNIFAHANILRPKGRGINPEVIQMKKLLTIATLAVISSGALLSSPAYADEELAKTAVYGYDTYTCEELADLDYEKVGSIVYYIRGHYDAKRDIWAGYEPGKQTRIEDDFYLPVEDIYNFCVENPKSTVMEALTNYND
jgi:hypothetical protein